MSSNRELLIRTVRKIEPLLDRLVFVGGAVVELYFTDPASDRVRPTTDTDCLCEVTSYTEYFRLGDRLRELSFRQSLRDADPPYRWRSGDDVLDVMPTDPSVLGFSNPWYDAALEDTWSTEIADDIEIRVPAPPVLLATKLAAHEDRGADDPLTSADLEDVIALLANRPELVDEVEAADRVLREWIGRRVARFLPSEQAGELIAAFLPETRQVPELRSTVTDRVAEIRKIAD